MDEIKVIRPCAVIPRCTVVEFTVNPESPIAYDSEIHSMGYAQASTPSVPNLRNPNDRSQ